MCCGDSQSIEIIDKGVRCKDDIDVTRVIGVMIAEHGTHLPGIRNITHQ